MNTEQRRSFRMSKQVSDRPTTKHAAYSDVANAVRLFVLAQIAGVIGFALSSVTDVEMTRTGVEVTHPNAGAGGFMVFVAAVLALLAIDKLIAGITLMGAAADVADARLVDAIENWGAEE